jgi:hypothetical protein
MFILGNRHFGISSVSSSNVKQTRKNNQLTLVEEKTKGKSNPMTGLTGSEGSRRLRLSDFKIIGT